MSFLSAIFIWALPLAAAPIVIHLLHRRQQKVIRWGAMQFLVDSTRRRRRIWRLDDWLLMLLRCAALLVLVLALARPLVRAAWVGAGPERDVILVLDVSMSMGRTVADQTPWDRLQQQVDNVLGRLSNQDAVQVLLAAATPLWQTSEPVSADSAELAALRERLRTPSPSLGPGDLLAAVEQALAADPGPNVPSRLIAVITDGRAQGMPADPRIAADRLQQQLRNAAVPTVVNFMDVGDAAESIHNLAVDRMESDRALAGAGEQVLLKARVTNYGTRRLDATELRWTVGDETLNTSFIPPLEPGATTTVTIEQAFDEPGLHVLTCRTESRDELPADNEARLILEVRDTVPILVVASTDAVESDVEEARYFLAALGRRGDADLAAAAFFEPTLVHVADFGQTDLAPYLAVVFTDAPPLTDPDVRRLVEFVSAGGGLWLALGGDTDPDIFNQFLGADVALSPVRLGIAVGDEQQDAQFTTLHPPADGHPATALLGDTARLDIRDAHILRRWQLEPPRPDAELSVLLETARGAPVAVEHFVGRGRVIVQAFPLTRAWSNLTLCKLYVPYVHEWLRYLVQPSIATHNLAINEPLVWRRPGTADQVDAVLAAPLQAPVTLTAEPERDSLAYRYYGTVYPGDYTLALVETEPAVPFQVKRDPAESNLRAWPDSERNAFSGVAEVRFVDDALEWPGDIQVKPASAPAWSWLLWGLAALVCVELASICWFAWRKRAVRRLPAAA